MQVTTCKGISNPNPYADLLFLSAQLLSYESCLPQL
jgi:hypothetical protein